MSVTRMGSVLPASVHVNRAADMIDVAMRQPHNRYGDAAVLVAPNQREPGSKWLSVLHVGPESFLHKKAVGGHAGCDGPRC